MSDDEFEDLKLSDEDTQRMVEEQSSARRLLEEKRVSELSNLDLQTVLAARTHKSNPRHHAFVVFVKDCTYEQACEVLRERLGHDEDYGFPYGLDW